jgi:hypothetical protein
MLTGTKNSAHEDATSFVRTKLNDEITNNSGAIARPEAINGVQLNFLWQSIQLLE